MNNGIPKDVMLHMHKKMLLIRKFEEKVAYFFSRGVIHGTCHLCIGEEATSVGTVTALKQQDFAHGTHRGHGQAISWGLEVKYMMAEIFGKQTGYCKGKGGSMHIADITKGFLGANGIVGGGIPLALGGALSLKLQKKEDTIMVGFFGDGAVNEGSFHESANMAALYKLPILFVCINNYYGMSTHVEKSMSEPDIAKRAAAYRIPAKTIDGNNVAEVYETVKAAREYVAKNGPMMVVCNTYRISGHSKSDANRYRSKEEIEEWKKRDPLQFSKKFILDNNIALIEEIELLEKQAEQEIEEAVKFAENSPIPSMDELLSDVYA